MSVLQTEFEFTLPMGYVDEAGTLHKNGAMRLATAADEILPAKDPRVQQNPAYLTIILLVRVVIRLGSLNTINTKTVEGLFARDFCVLAGNVQQGQPERLERCKGRMPKVCAYL
ncbi:MAG: hypothetical protein HW390_2436 [Candidatus Brocadiaceae bacterium]|nr:hypothetical protein [Candidatus Brocadiaceae bacterium]